MKVWLCKFSEPLPFKRKSRKFRVGMIAEELRKRQHDVIWWTSTVDHAKKTKLYNLTSLENGTKIAPLDGINYKKNISLQRVINHSQMGREFTKKAQDIVKPDLIYSSMPTLDFAYRAVKYAKENKVPSIIDIRDLWPDVFLNMIPFELLRNNTLLYPWNKKLKYILINADYIIGITKEYLEWALNKVNIPFNEERHKVFPLGYDKVVGEHVSPFKDNKFQITFAGTIGHHFDLETVFKAAELLIHEEVNINILGNGDLLKEYREKYSELKNVNFVGWVEGSLLSSYLLYSDLGIAPYKNTINFQKNIANKPYEYMAHSLPIITCLRGATETLIKSHNLGYFYYEQNPVSLANVIKKTKNNKQDLINKIRNNKKTFERHFNSTIIYTELIEFMETIVVKNNKENH